MKALKFTSIVLLLFLGSGLFTACKKDKKTVKAVEKNIVEGTWRVTKMIDSGTDETSDFSGFTFTFSESGSVSATNGSTTYSGTWSVSTSSSSSDDSNDGDIDFNLSFSVTEDNDFDDLIDDWDVLSQSETKIELMDVSGGNGGTDYLTFEKN